MHCSACRELIVCMYLFQNNPIRGKQRRRNLPGSCCLSSLNLVPANKCCSEWGRVMKYLRQWAASHLQALILVCFFYCTPWPSTHALLSSWQAVPMPGGLRATQRPCRHLLPATHVVGPDTSSQMGEGIPRGNSSALRPWRERFGNCWQNLV